VVEIGKPRTAREVALEVLLAVERDGAYANLALDAALTRHRLAPRDRALVTELVYGTLRRRNTLDWALAPHSRRPLSSLDAAVRNILRLGAYQLLYLEGIPARAACNESVETARRFGFTSAAGLVNAVLRHLQRSLPLVFPDAREDPASHLALYHSHPRWLVAEWLETYGFEETAALLAAGNLPAPFTVRANTLKTTPAELARRLEAAGVPATPARFAPEGLYLEKAAAAENPLFAAGWYFIQDEAAMLAARALAPSPGALVIDLCSAPGGKTTHLAALMGGGGQILAVDVHPHRLDLLAENCRRLGVANVRGHLADGRSLPGYHARADFVLVDAPCSGLGVLRRRPDLRWRKSPEDMAGLAVLQAELLDEAARCLRPGGVVVYSTCTIRRAENEAQVEGFLARHPAFQRGELPLPPALTAGSVTGQVQLLPHRHRTDGFFIARLVRSRG